MVGVLFGDFLRVWMDSPVCEQAPQQLNSLSLQEFLGLLRVGLFFSFSFFTPSLMTGSLKLNYGPGVIIFHAELVIFWTHLKWPHNR